MNTDIHEIRELRHQLHTPEFDFNDEIIETAVDMMRALAGC